jgi:hypothetical protein
MQGVTTLRTNAARAKTPLEDQIFYEDPSWWVKSKIIKGLCRLNVCFYWTPVGSSRRALANAACAATQARVSAVTVVQFTGW